MISVLLLASLGFSPPKTVTTAEYRIESGGKKVGTGSERLALAADGSGVRSVIQAYAPEKAGSGSRTIVTQVLGPGGVPKSEDLVAETGAKSYHYATMYIGTAARVRAEWSGKSATRLVRRPQGVPLGGLTVLIAQALRKPGASAKFARFDEESARWTVSTLTLKSRRGDDAILEEVGAIGGTRTYMLDASRHPRLVQLPKGLRFVRTALTKGG